MPSGRAPMPVSERAKLFVPFSPLRGFEEALRRVEMEAEAGAAVRCRAFAQLPTSERAAWEAFGGDPFAEDLPQDARGPQGAGCARDAESCGGPGGAAHGRPSMG